MPPRLYTTASKARLTKRSVLHDSDDHDAANTKSHNNKLHDQQQHSSNAKKVLQENLESHHNPPSRDTPSGSLERNADQNKLPSGATRMSDVPIPIPDTGIHRSLDTTHAHSQSSSTKSSSSTTASHLPTASVPSHSFYSVLALPTTTLLASISTISQSQSLSQSVSSPLPSTAANLSASSSKGLHLSTLAISLLASGAALLLISIVIIIKVCTRPRRRTTPTPSLPILTDGFEDYKGSPPEDSPLFGGKERTSHQDFVWPVYPRPIPIPMPTEPVQVPTYSQVAHQAQLKVPEPVIASPRPIRQMQGAIRRLSMSWSGEEEPRQAHALSRDDPPLTADGHQVMERNKSSRKSVRHSLQQQQQSSRRRSHSQQQQSLAYDGADVMTPHVSHIGEATFGVPIAIATPSPAHGGRCRIKSSYFTTYPRASVAPASESTTNANFIQNAEAPEVPLQRSESRRNRDTRALAAALGLGSPSPICPPPPSPQPMDLDISHRRMSKKSFLSRAGDRTAEGQGRSRPVSAFSPTLDASSALGNLMLMDYGTSKSLANLSSLDGGYHHLDKPPRVPSPPPLPSLAQMGLERSLPEAFASYRSPTYSIFGLYEPEERSKKRVSQLRT
ncbi:hypothetical protein ONZ45_g11329 [Pleurotus djamor]|nr:hypothetical protein ONZ45_g11329 [Pleurotus djamor]